VVSGPLKIPSVSKSREMGTNAWNFQAASAFHASSDASLFSSSLPVLPHEKCMPFSSYEILCVFRLFLS